MCLSSVEKIFDIATRSSKKAWKIVRFNKPIPPAPKGSYETCCYPAFITSSWQVAEGTTIESVGQDLINFSYSAGFHTFARKKDAQKELSKWNAEYPYYQLIPVEIDEIHIQGLDMGIKPMSAIKFVCIPQRGNSHVFIHNHSNT
jgi:hypothetical protein